MSESVASPSAAGGDKAATGVGSCCGSLLYIVLSTLALLVVAWQLPPVRKARHNLHHRILAKMIAKFSATNGPAVEPYKARLFADLKNDQSTCKGARTDANDKPDHLTIVEIGAGSGVNFKYYPKGAKVICVEPNVYCEEHLMERLKTAGEDAYLDVEFKVGKAEDMSFIDSGSVDVVVCTLVLCSVDDVEKTLREVHRILKPGGKYYYMEHIAEEAGSRTRKLQEFFAPPWRKLMECRMALDAEAAIRRAGFSTVESESVRIREISKTIGGLTGKIMFLFWRHLFGTATK